VLQGVECALAALSRLRGPDQPGRSGVVRGLSTARRLTESVGALAAWSC